jgi:hypothetical protein
LIDFVALGVRSATVTFTPGAEACCQYAAYGAYPARR